MVVEKAAKEVSKAVSNDIAVFRTRFDVETGKGRKKRLTPVEAELHLNPVSILFAAAAGLVGALAATVAWQGISIPGPLGVGQVVLFPGMKDSGFGKDLNRWYERQKLKRMGATVVESRINLSAEEKALALEASIGDTNCQLLNREWQTAIRAGRVEDAASLLERAKAAMCPWTRGL